MGLLRWHFWKSVFRCCSFSVLHFIPEENRDLQQWDADDVKQLREVSSKEKITFKLHREIKGIHRDIIRMQKEINSGNKTKVNSSQSVKSSCKCLHSVASNLWAWVISWLLSSSPRSFRNNLGYLKYWGREANNWALATASAALRGLL